MKATTDSRQPARPGKRTWWWLAVGLAVPLVFWVGRALTREDEVAAVRREAAEVPRVRVLTARAESDHAETHEERPGAVVPATVGPPAVVVTSHQGEVVGAAPNAPHEPGMVPHPLDAARARIHAENRLIQNLNDAMSFRQVATMRALLAEYRTLDPTDTDASQAGYAVIADCIELPGEASLAAAHAFYDTERHSPLRRYVRRVCFENVN